MSSLKIIDRKAVRGILVLSLLRMFFGDFYFFWPLSKMAIFFFSIAIVVSIILLVFSYFIIFVLIYSLNTIRILSNEFEKTNTRLITTNLIMTSLVAVAMTALFLGFIIVEIKYEGQ
jgi:hypothetical protein